MAYQKQNFVNGLPLSAAQLNHIEEGIEELEKKIPEQGKPGSDGYTPVRGVDYWTDSDKETIIQEAITALGTPVFGTVDEDNNIILTGNLVAGTYTLKYEDAYGNITDIGTLSTVSADTNLLPAAIESDGTPFNNGQGYISGYRLNSSGVQTAQDGAYITGFIPAVKGDIVYLSDITLYLNGKKNGYGYVWLYDENFNVLQVDSLVMGCALREQDDQSSAIAAGSLAVDSNNILKQFTINKTTFYSQTDTTLNSVRYIRISADSINENSIVSVNYPIE